jgi:hypothetical protein
MGELTTIVIAALFTRKMLSTRHFWYITVLNKVAFIIPLSNGHLKLFKKSDQQDFGVRVEAS